MKATQDKLVNLIEYVEQLIRLDDNPVFALQEYRQPAFHEASFIHGTGIEKNSGDQNGPFWLRIRRLKRSDPPEIPDPLKDWIVQQPDPFYSPRVRKSILIERADTQEEGVHSSAPAGETLQLKDFPEIQRAASEYIDSSWTKWAEAEKPRRHTIRIYEAFFNMQQTIQSQGSDRALELVWGIGMARWQTEEITIDHPLIEQLIEFEIDSNDASIIVRPRSALPELALKPYFVSNNPGAEIVMSYARKFFGEFAEGVELSPFIEDTFVPILRKAASHLDQRGRYYPDDNQTESRDLPPCGDMLTVTDTWVIFARHRSDNFFLKDLAKLKSSVRTTAHIPGPSRRLVTEPAGKRSSANLAIDIAKGTLSRTEHQASIRAKQLDEASHEQNFFFPKPFNEYQKSIIERLDQADGVVVQGPPGTGKTHTIANIICHYLATGKRVLVSSKSEAALAVLQEHIPADIRDLTISLLTSEREGLKQLERAISILTTAATQVDPKQLERDIISSQRKIQKLKERISDIDSELFDIAESHLRAVPNSDSERDMLPMELAEQVVNDRERHAWFPDQLEAAGQRGSDRGEQNQADGCLFTDKDIADARTARRSLGPDLEYLDKPLLPLQEMPDAESIADIHVDLINANKLKHKTIANNIPKVSARESVWRVEKLLDSIEAIVDFHERIKDSPWLNAVLVSWHREGIDAPKFSLLRDLLPSLKHIAAQRKRLLKEAISLPYGVWKDPEFNLAIERLTTGRRPFGLLPFGKNQLKGLLADVYLLGRKPQCTTDWQKIQSYLRWRQDVSTFIYRWNAIAPEYDFPTIRDEEDDSIRWITHTEDLLRHMEKLLNREVLYARAELTQLFPEGLELDAILSSRTDAERSAEAIKINLSMKRLSSSKDQLETFTGELKDYSGALFEELRLFVRNELGNPSNSPADIANRWQLFIKALTGLHALVPQMKILKHIAELVKNSGAPNWAKALLTRPVLKNEEDPWTPETWMESWRRVRQYAFLMDIDDRNRMHALSDSRREAEQELRTTIGETVKLRTYLGLKVNITERVESALVMYTSAVRRIGKGTGIRAHRFRKDAQKAMENAYSAVPCWIMPGWRVSESLPPDLGSFDLVIIDEASQSDIYSLPVLLRGQKVLVVGDDKQVSPTAAFVEERKLLQLKHNFLRKQHFGALMLPGVSLYDLAGAVFAGERIMLREHFRCVEPIIRFSFQFYNEDIYALRLPSHSERMDPPLVDVYLPHGKKNKLQINVVEANAIVDEIERIISVPEWRKRSIGVVSLIGSKQAEFIQSLLLERVGEEPFINNRIACGDSADFQGKERDIMFVSMVECSETKSAKTALLFQQRFNVALSRARDRMYLFRSVEESMLSPEDLKAKVIRHFKSPMAEKKLRSLAAEDLTETPQEKDLLQRLVGLGYRVMPKVKVGPYTIDLVVEGSKDRRLAIELDGDQDHSLEHWQEDNERQRVLERVGWHFWRVWAVSYILAPETCIRDLTGRLESMGIKPIGGEPRRGCYTEHRVIERPPIVDQEETAAESSEKPAPISNGNGAKSTSTSKNRKTSAKINGSRQSLDNLVPDELENETIVEVGDRVLVAYADDPKSQHTLTISSQIDDPEMKIVKSDQPLAMALINSQVDDEIEISVDKKVKNLIVVKIDKANPG